MKKVCLILVIFTLFVFAGCGSSNETTDEPTNPTDEPTNPTDEPTNPTDDPTEPTDDPTNPTDEPTEPTDDPTNPTDEPTNPTDEPTNPTDEPTNPTEPTDPTDDSDNPQNDNDSTDPNDDSGDPQNDNDSTDPNNDSDDPQNDADADTDTQEPEIVCTGFSLDASTFIPYYEGVYAGFVADGILGDGSLPDKIELDFFGGIAVNTYTSGNYDCTGTACMFVTQDYGTEGETLYFQKKGTIDVSEYDPETFEMSATISSTLVEVTVGTDGYIHLKQNGACITIETGVVRAVEQSEKTETCADIYSCFDDCEDNPEYNEEDKAVCKRECYSNSTTVARTQFESLNQCDEENNCNGNFRCWYEHCLEQEEICGMKNDPNYHIPYGQLTISGTFPYLHAEGENDIYYVNTMSGAFVTGTYGNDGKNIVDTTGTPYSYARISHFKAPNEDELNLTLIQTYKESGKTPQVHIVTTISKSGDYKFGLGEWESEARIFVSKTDSNGERLCDYAFGIGTVSLSISGNPVDSIGEIATGSSTEITVSGEATLYSYKATPDYGGDITDGKHWIACEE